MAVPTTGNFLMFGTGSNATIAGAIIEGGASSETVASTLNFNALKSLADINKFDVEFKEGATTLEQIVKSTQFRGYPIAGTTTTTTIGPSIIIANFYSTGTDPSLVALTCASTSSYNVQIFGDPGNDSPTFCGPDELLAIDITNILADGHSIPVGSTFYLSSGGQVRTWIRQFDNNLAYWYLDSCQACPTTTTTTTTSTTTTTTTTTVGPCSLTIYFDVSQSPGTQGWNSDTDACNGTGTPLTVYFSNTPNGCPTTFQDVFNDGKAIYTNPPLTTVLAGNDKWYKSAQSPNSGIAIQVGNDGFIDTLSAPCNPSETTTTTTTTTSPSTTTTTSTLVTTTTTSPTTTTTTTAAPICYVYEYVNNSGDTIDVNGTLCEGGAYSQPVGPGGEGATFCLQQLSQETIDAYAALGLVLTQAVVPCT